MNGVDSLGAFVRSHFFSLPMYVSRSLMPRRKPRQPVTPALLGWTGLPLIQPLTQPIHVAGPIQRLNFERDAQVHDVGTSAQLALPPALPSRLLA